MTTQKQKATKQKAKNIPVTASIVAALLYGSVIAKELSKIRRVDCSINAGHKGFQCMIYREKPTRR